VAQLADGAGVGCLGAAAGPGQRGSWPDQLELEFERGAADRKIPAAGLEWGISRLLWGGRIRSLLNKIFT